MKHGREIHYNADGSVSEIIIWDNGEYVGNEKVTK